MPSLIVESGRGRGRRFELPARGTITIGREASCSVQLSDSMASRVHCVLRCTNDEVVLEDRGATNKTLVNGLPVDRHVLQTGDSIQVGRTLLTYAYNEVDPLLGTQLDGYLIEARLGRGATGTVYRARQLSLDRPVAIKILAERFADNPDLIARFMEEARAAGRLSHPNLVQVYDAGQASGRHYIAMEFLEQGSLEEMLLREGRLTPSHVLRVARDSCAALAYAERQRIVHRDIKPANLMVASDGTVKIGDLGIATDLRTGPASDAIAGSPHYMAPEQARSADVDHRADLYGLGSTLYHAVSGQIPFDGETLREVLRNKLHTKPKPLRRLVADLPTGLERVIECLMAPQPQARFQSADEALEALAQVDRAAPRSVRPLTKTQTSRTPVLAWAVFIGLALIAWAIVHTAGGRTSLDPVVNSTPHDADDTAKAGDALPPPPSVPTADTTQHTDPHADRERELSAERERLENMRAIVARHLSSQEFSDAVAAARELHKVSADDAIALQEVIDAAIEETRGAADASIRTALKAGDIDSARTELDRLQRWLGDVDPSGVKELRDAVTKTVRNIERARSKLESAARRAEGHVARLDFDGARDVLGESPTEFPPLAERHERDLASLEAIATAWRQLSRGAAAHAAARSHLRLPGGDGADLDERPYRVTAVDDVRIQLTRESDVVERSLLSLPPAAIESLLPADTKLESVRTALERLVALRRDSQERKHWLPDDATVSSEDSDAAWIIVRLEAAEALQQRGALSAPTMRFLVDEVETLLRASHGAEEDADRRRRLRALFVAARADSLLAASPTQWFNARRARVVPPADGERSPGSDHGPAVELAYTFTEDAELLDFQPLNRTSSVTVSDSSLALRGECRFASGDLFVGRLAVEARPRPFRQQLPKRQHRSVDEFR